MGKTKKFRNAAPDYQHGRFDRQWDEKIYFWIIKIGLYLILFTPFLVKTGFLFPFVSLKTVSFRILVEIIFAVYLLLVIRFPQYRPRWSPLVLSVGLFVFVVILTGLTGINIKQSMWSTFERMTGIFTFLHLFVFFVILTSVFRDWKEWRIILIIALIAAALQSLYAFIAPDYARGGGTIGNDSFLAAYLLLNIFLGAALFFREKSGGWRVFYGFLLFIIIWKLFTTPAQAAVLSFLGGIFLLFAFYGWHYFNSRGRKYALIFILSLVGAALIMGFIFQGAIKTKITGIIGSPTIQARSLVWQGAWQGWKEKFWLGWGPENFNAVFNKYFDPRIAYSEYGGEIWFDRAHNIIFDLGVTSGLVGLISYFSIFGVSFFALWRKYLLTKNGFAVSAALTISLITYFVQNLTVFDMINSYLIFFLTLSFIDFWSRDPEDDLATEVVGERKLRSWFTVFLAIFIIFLIFKANIQPLAASRWVEEAQNNPHKRTFGEVLDIYEERVPKIWWGRMEIRESLARIVSEYVQGMPSEQIPEDLRRGLLLAAAESKKNIDENPLDFRPHLVLVDMYNLLSSIDKTFIPLAEDVLNRGIKLSPANFQIYQQFGQNRLYAGDFEKAIIYYQRAIDLAPKLANSHWFLSQAYKAAGQPQLGLAAAQKAIELGYDGESLDSFIHMADLQLQRGNVAAAISIYNDAVKIYPNDTRLYINLAVIYKNIDDKEKAHQMAKKVGELDPNLVKSTEEFIASLGLATTTSTTTYEKN